MITTTLSREVLSKYMNPCFVETGTANGDCVRLALEVGFEKIYSVELDAVRQASNREVYSEFIDRGRVNLITGDSLFELKTLIPTLNKSTTFWLDAHVDDGVMGAKRCPLYEELEAIGMSSIKSHTVLIDDMRILGGHWGEGITIEELKARLLSINPNYNITFENGFVPNDIMVAYL